jgi:DHA2 family multidrug resistance protein-like MFS transporter
MHSRRRRTAAEGEIKSPEAGEGPAASSGLFGMQPGDDGLPPDLRRMVMLAIVMSTIISVIDTTMVNIALPTIARELGITTAASIWVAKVSLLTTAMSVVAFAALGDAFGFKRIFVGGLVLFTLGALGSALSNTLATLLLFRCLQGFGTAAVVCVGPALFRLVFPSRLLGTVFGINAMVVAGSVAFGPIFGGLLLSIATWPWLFAIALPFGAWSLYLARALPPDVGRGGGFDGWGAVFSAAAMGLAILALDGRPHSSPGSQIAAAASALAALALFIVRQRRAATPLLPLDMFSASRFSVAASTSFCSFVAQGIAFVALPFLFQGDYGRSPLQAALLFSPWPVAIIIAAPLSGRLADTYPPAVLSTAGLALLTVGLALFTKLGEDPGIMQILWHVFICGIGFGVFQAPNNREMLSAVERRRAGAAAGVMALARTFGQTVGLALVSVTLAAVVGAAAVNAALWVAAATAGLACLLSASRLVPWLRRTR